MRFLGLVFTALAILATLIDLSRSADVEGVIVLRPLGAHWFDLHPDSLQLAQPAIERHVAPVLWSGVVQPVLETPATIVFAIAALICFFFSWRIGRRRKARGGADG